MPRSDRVEDTTGTNTSLVNPSWGHSRSTDVGLPPRLKETDASTDLPEEEESWVGTLIFLAGLVLFGLAAGYLLRGGNAEGAERSFAMPSALLSVSGEPSYIRDESSVTPTLAAFGSDAPDELLSLHVLSSGSDLAGVVRLHNTRRDAPDRVSFVRVSSTGLVTETELANGGQLKAVEMAEMPGREYIASSLSPDALSVQNLDRNGRVDWLRTFPISEAHKAEIDVATVSSGSFTVGPGERPDRIGLIHLGPGGDLIWQRSFPADPFEPDVHIVAGSDESVFVAMRNIATAAPEGSHTLMRVQADGQVIWKQSIDLGEASLIHGFDVGSDGHVMLLASGAVATLSKYNSNGVQLWTSIIPSVTQQDELYLVKGESGEAIVASTYSMLGQRLYVSMQRWTQDGQHISDHELALPAQSSLDVLSVDGSGNLILAGSVLPERYEDADVYVKTSKLDMSSWIPRADAPEPIVMSLATEGGEAMTIAASTVPTEPRSAQPVEAIEPVIEDALPPVEDVVVTSAEPVLSSEPSPEAAIETVTEPEAETLLASGGQVEQLLNQAAQSVLLTPGEMTQAQCRFTCLEQRGASTFPMWASVEAPASTFATGLTDVHAQVCSAARGRIYQNVRPDCQYID